MMLRHELSEIAAGLSACFSSSFSGPVLSAGLAAFGR